MDYRLPVNSSSSQELTWAQVCQLTTVSEEQRKGKGLSGDRVSTNNNEAAAQGQQVIHGKASD